MFIYKSMYAIGEDKNYIQPICEIYFDKPKYKNVYNFI